MDSTTHDKGTSLETGMQRESAPERNKVDPECLSQSIARRALFAKGLAIGASVIGLNLLEGQPSASAAIVAALKPSPARLSTQSTTQLHFCGRATNGRLFHTIRFPGGSWQPSFGDVNAQESNGNTLHFTDVDCAGIVDNLQLTALGRDGIIWHTIRFANGTWAPSFGNVNNQESNGSFLRFNHLGCAGTMSGKLQLTAIGRDGIIWHTIRFPNGTWAPAFGNVNNQESNGGSLRFIDVDCATIGEDLHVTALGRDGIIWHTIRFANGSWAPAFGNVNNQESNGGSLRFTDVGCASIGGNLHVTALGRDGVIWHTIRFANGSWAPAFGNVNNQESNGGSLRFTDVDCANVADTLHVTAIDQSDIVWHTIRFANGSWQSSFGDVNNQESNGSSLSFTALGAAGVV
ncbi:hypothetical protein [Dictyobacter kobayashii]|uniref:Uncharacterized protein n=1 Tax=Dictyobacter kobayashii TaxID=2014872 RepID=A0A402ANL8_9CHLR|nr:hypothetical protein [Dictyobacter kobayashii]GCE20788.1 hypothetical protein KDK_45880 [Dictyobacter kobayashii]